MDLRRIFVTSFIFLSACSTAPVRAPAMIGGMEMQHPSEVYLGNCTGTIIAPHIVLTAGHCLLGINDERKVSYLYKSGDEVLIQSFDGPAERPKRSFIVHVAEVAAHPSWEAAIHSSNESADSAAEKDGVSDVAVIILDQSLPVAPAALPTIDVWENTPKDAIGLLVFGAGCQQRGNDLTAGTMKAALFTDIQRFPLRLEVKPQDAISGGPAGPCKRDSGGGAFLLQKNQSSGNTLSLSAVASIMTGSAEDALAASPTGLYLARIDKPGVLDWLQKFISQKAPQKVAPNLQ